MASVTSCGDRGSTCLCIHERAQVRGGVVRRRRSGGGHPLGEAGDEFVRDAGLDIDAVGADAGLAAVAQFGEHGTFDSLVEVGVIEHDQGCVAARVPWTCS